MSFIYLFYYYYYYYFFREKNKTIGLGPLGT